MVQAVKGCKVGGSKTGDFLNRAELAQAGLLSTGLCVQNSTEAFFLLVLIFNGNPCYFVKTKMVMQNYANERILPELKTFPT